MRLTTEIGSIDLDLSGESSGKAVNAVWRGLLTPTPGNSVNSEGVATNTGESWAVRTVRSIPPEATTEEELSIVSAAVVVSLDDNVPLTDDDVIDSIATGDRKRIEALYAQLDRAERQAERLLREIDSLRSGLPV